MDILVSLLGYLETPDMTKSKKSGIGSYTLWSGWKLQTKFNRETFPL